jgi:hypothetical protein
VATVSACVAWAGHAGAADPTKQECVIANESAQDLQRAAKLVEARAQLLTCASSACPTVVRQDCADRLQSVEQSLPTLVLLPRDASGGDAAGASLAIDGVGQSTALDGTPLGVDPGTHTFTVSLSGREPVSLQLELKEGDRVRREVVFKAAGRIARAGAPPGSEAEAGAVAFPGSGQGSAITTRRIAWAAIGAGAAGMTLGTVFGFLAIARKAALESACHETVCPDGQEYNIAAMHVNGVASNFSFAIGVLGLGAGGVLLWAYPQGVGAEAPRDGGHLVVRPWAGLGDVGVSGRFR